MNYTKISPLGPRVGPGTYDGLWDTEKYGSMEEAISANDIVVVDFAEDETGVKYFMLTYSNMPGRVILYRFRWQNIPGGVDDRDDEVVIGIARAMLMPENWEIPIDKWQPYIKHLEAEAYKMVPHDGRWMCNKCGSKNTVTGADKKITCNDCGASGINPFV